MADREARGGTLVVGGGFAGAYVARLLKKNGATIVSPENFMLYTPMLPEAASGTLEPRHVVVPLRIMCPHAELFLGRATELDLARNLAVVASGDAVIAVGGRWGTLAEIGFAHVVGRPVVILEPGWELEGVARARSPQEAVELALGAVENRTK